MQYLVLNHFIADTAMLAVAWTPLTKSVPHLTVTILLERIDVFANRSREAKHSQAVQHPEYERSQSGHFYDIRPTLFGAPNQNNRTRSERQAFQPSVGKMLTVLGLVEAC
eukprot:COSAG02_NODE_1402_length_12818_cov_18.233352_11_plen_110_part_00